MSCIHKNVFKNKHNYLYIYILKFLPKLSISDGHFYIFVGSKKKNLVKIIFGTVCKLLILSRGKISM